MKLKLKDITLFNRIFEAEEGWLLDFNNRTITQFFDEELNIDIDDEQYRVEGNSKAKRVRCLLKKVDSDTALLVLNKLWSYKAAKNPEGYKNSLADFNFLIDSIQNTDASESAGLAPKKSYSGIDYQGLIDDMDRIKVLQPHPRGYEFEKWLKNLFSVFRMDPRGSFRNTGEQIDGSFSINSEHYLMEAKWHSKQTPASDLNAFQGKLRTKASWTRGVFISWHGFTEDGLVAFGKGHKVVCISGKDIYECLKAKIPFPVLLEAKVRHASETGECYIAYNNIKNLPKF